MHEKLLTESEHSLEALTQGMNDLGVASSMELVAYGGSIAYGLDTENSDIDLRGFFLPARRDLLTFKDAGTIEVKDGVDAAMHSANKILSLLCACNPNVIEILGLRPEHVLIRGKWYDEILANKHMFVSAKCSGTFGGYAVQQLRRIQNSMSRDKGDTDTEGALRSMKAAIASFDDKYSNYLEGSIEVKLADDTVGAKALYLTLDMKDVPITEIRGMCGDLDAIAKNADNLAARNRKKETSKLSKHMSHLIRLLRMGSELLESGEINTYRDKDAELLLKLKQGMWMEEDSDGTRHIDDAFWDLLATEQKRFEYAEDNTVLPQTPDRDGAVDLLCEMHASVLEN